MADPNSSYSQLLSTTIDNYSPTMADNVTNHNSLLFFVNKKGNIDSVSGGVKILQNIMYQDNGKLHQLPL